MPSEDSGGIVVVYMRFIRAEGRVLRWGADGVARL
jgi:hypothetical protein